MLTLEIRRAFQATTKFYIELTLLALDAECLVKYYGKRDVLSFLACLIIQRYSSRFFC
jgi:hypothetical protein